MLSQLLEEIGAITWPVMWTRVAWAILWWVTEWVWKRSKNR